MEWSLVPCYFLAWIVCRLSPLAVTLHPYCLNWLAFAHREYSLNKATLTALPGTFSGLHWPPISIGLIFVPVLLPSSLVPSTTGFLHVMGSSGMFYKQLHFVQLGGLYLGGRPERHLTVLYSDFASLRQSGSLLPNEVHNIASTHNVSLQYMTSYVHPNLIKVT
jgi:hypothetical protein